MTRSNDPATFLAILHDKHTVFELRAMDCPERRGVSFRSTASGNFNSAEEAAKAALKLDLLEPPGIYCTFNPAASALLARSKNAFKHKAKATTTDADILCRRWLMIDIDPERPSDVSSTEAEMNLALELAGKIRDELASEGWCDPMLVMSGNGACLLYPANESNDDATRDLFRNVLHGLGDRFDTATVKIDRAPFNASRGVKLPGTTARKGDDFRGVDGIEDRPHRVVWFEAPSWFGKSKERPTVTREQLKAIAKEPPAAKSPAEKTRQPAAQSSFDKCLKYLDKMTPSVSGEHGHDKALAAACEIYRFGLDDGEARAAFDRFNQNCIPPWNDREIVHKLQQAREKVTSEGTFGTKGLPGQGAVKRAATKRTKKVAVDSSHAILIDAELGTVADVYSQITTVLAGSGRCFLRAGKITHIFGDTPYPIDSAAELAGMVSMYSEVAIVDGRDLRREPLAPKWGGPYLNNPEQLSRLPLLNLFTRSPCYTQGMRLVLPGFDPDSGIFYAGPMIAPRDGTERLNQLLSGFCFRSVADRTNFIGILLTALLMSRFIGSKPALLLNGNQAELGKSILAQICAIIRDGHSVTTVSYNANDEEFEKTLGARVRGGLATIIIDNAKARGKRLTIDSAVLERSITDEILSFRLLGHSATIEAENSHQFIITANSAEVSRDLFTRCLICNLHWEGDPTLRQFPLADPEGFAAEHREELLGELIGMVERWKSAGMRSADEIHTRFNKKGWGQIIGGILQANGEPDFMANQEAAAAAMDATSRDFGELVSLMASEVPLVSWTAADLVAECQDKNLLPEIWADGSKKAHVTRMGIVAGRFRDVDFEVPQGKARFLVKDDAHSKSKSYRVAIFEEQKA